jgi:hypothetical protein
MKNVVFMTAMVDAPDKLEYTEWCYKTWEYWCKKNDVELFILEDELQPKRSSKTEVGMKPTWQRWHVHEVLEANDIEYDQVALVDVDTMVHWNCPNFFNQTNGQFSAVRDIINIGWIQQSIDGYQDMFPNLLDWPDYFNCGFIVMSKKHKEWCKSVTDFYYENADELRRRQHETVKKGSDQTPINYMIRKSEHKVNLLNEKFNHSHLHLRGVLQDDLLWKTGWVWHFNGFEKSQRTNVMKQIWERIGSNYGLNK